ncbi:hypothetical protein F5X99DRAFT_377003 [Biscogniauxia marginata]|nr:hypothetical protein F5X99DRAFT_377003 [Biscogniauxia marginata]
MVREIAKQNSDRVLRSTRNDSRVQKSKDSTSNPASNRRSLRANIRHENVQGQVQKHRAPRTKTKKPQHSYLLWSETDVSLDTNRKAWLLALPREIVQKIASHLPPESTICLTLSCKLALHILGTASWTDDSIRQRWSRDPGTRGEHRASFIELLSRDLKPLGFEPCARCNTLHPPLKKPSEHRYAQLTKYCWGQSAAIDYLPQGVDGTGYGLVLEHIIHTLDSTSPESTSPIEYLSGSYEVPSPAFNYTISSCGRRVNGNLIIQHDYAFRPLSPKTPLKAVDILSLPLRICPHQSTTTEAPPQNRYLTDNRRNGPLLTHAIASAFPASKRVGIAKAASFRDPTALEQQMMSAADGSKDVTYRCRACPTKWKVEYGRGSNGDELKIGVFHCFYRELYVACRTWPCFVRREGYLLGKDTRNSEFWSRSKSSPDFKIE